MKFLQLRIVDSASSDKRRAEPLPSFVFFAIRTQMRTKYSTNTWLRCYQKWGEEQGVESNIVRVPKSVQNGILQQFYAKLWWPRVWTRIPKGNASCFGLTSSGGRVQLQHSEVEHQSWSPEWQCSCATREWERERPRKVDALTEDWRKAFMELWGADFLLSSSLSQPG